LIYRCYGDYLLSFLVYLRSLASLASLERKFKGHHRHHVTLHNPKAVATDGHEVRLRARFKGSEAGKLRKVQIESNQLMPRPHLPFIVVIFIFSTTLFVWSCFRL